MKKQLIVCICTMAPLYGAASMRHIFDEMDQHMLQMHEQMEHVLLQMSEHAHATQYDGPQYSLAMHEKDDYVTVELSLPKKVTSSDVSVEMEDGALDVLVQAEGDRIELKISGTYVTMSSSKNMRRETKNDKGATQTFAAGSSHMSQMLPLPTKVDLMRKAPQADLTDGLLTLTLAKKGSQKIPVNVASPHAAPGVLPAREETIDFEK